MIQVAGSKLIHVANGVIVTTTAHSLGVRLAILHRAIEVILAEHAPEAVAVEQAFVAKDPLAALKLGHARAIALLAGAQAGLALAEYAPNQIKKSVVGVGHADKLQVQAMIKRLLPAARVDIARCCGRARLRHRACPFPRHGRAPRRARVMIGKLTGRVDFIGADHAIIDVGGVGYVVYCGTATLSRLTAGSDAVLHVETKLSEDALRLYGFLSTEEREWFRLLQTVQGVGARVALSLLSTLKIPELERAVVLGDKSVVGRAPGVGPKLATRIVTELKDKAPAMAWRAARIQPSAMALQAPARAGSRCGAGAGETRLLPKRSGASGGARCGRYRPERGGALHRCVGEGSLAAIVALGPIPLFRI